MTKSACNQATVRKSKSKRGAAASPAWGPEPVTKVPTTITRNVRITWPRASAWSVFLPSVIRSYGVFAFVSSDCAPAIKMIESMK